MTFPLPQFLTDNLSDIIYYQNESLISAIAEKYNLNRSRLLNEYLFDKDVIRKKLFDNDNDNNNDNNIDEDKVDDNDEDNNDEDNDEDNDDY